MEHQALSEINAGEMNHSEIEKEFGLTCFYWFFEVGGKLPILKDQSDISLGKLSQILCKA